MTVSRPQLERLAADTGFQIDPLEKVLHLLDLLESLRSHPFLTDRLVLKGGTALNLFALDLPRLSVDIDLNYIGAVDRAEAIRAIRAGRTTLVSTGTGSGKTECFLYPIISKCLELRDANAAPGISAVIVYPMNALAEDQLGRLRSLLAGTGIPFGIYVGKTPDYESEVVGIRMPAGSSRADYEAKLDQVRREKRSDTVCPPEEVCSREVMRTPGKQPRIPADQRQAARTVADAAEGRRSLPRSVKEQPREDRCKTSGTQTIGTWQSGVRGGRSRTRRVAGRSVTGSGGPATCTRPRRRRSVAPGSVPRPARFGGAARRPAPCTPR